jgi:hypothetical protein
MTRYRRKMTTYEAAHQLDELDPVPPPPRHPGDEFIVGNRIRWAAKVIRYSRYQRRLRKLQRLARP